MLGGPLGGGSWLLTGRGGVGSGQVLENTSFLRAQDMSEHFLAAGSQSAEVGSTLGKCHTVARTMSVRRSKVETLILPITDRADKALVSLGQSDVVTAGALITWSRVLWRIPNGVDQFALHLVRILATWHAHVLEGEGAIPLVWWVGRTAWS